MNYWIKFYENLLEYNDLNVNYKDYNSQTIKKIKDKNYFFNESKYLDMNLFFKFYKNYEQILKALNKSFFYFDVKEDFILSKVKAISYNFKEMIVKEIYGSIFYLFMRDDEELIDGIRKSVIENNYLRDDL